MEIIAEYIKEKRVQIDNVFKQLEAYEEVNFSSEIGTAVLYAKESKMWLGMVLKQLGTKNPYPDSKKPDNDKIEPTADTSQAYSNDMLDGCQTYIQEIKAFRKYATELYEEMNGKWEDENMVSDLKDRKVYLDGNSYFTLSIKSLMLANMWLGMELGRIHNEKGN